MISFEVGKSYRTSRGVIYTVTKRTDSFVMFTSTDGVKTFRRQPLLDVFGFEWVTSLAGPLDAREVIEAPASQPEKTQETQKGRKTMTKLTTEQVVTAVQSATTAEEVHAVLEQCKKDQLHEVVLAVTGDKHWLSPKSRTKAELVHSYTWGIMRHKEDEEFKSKPFEKKYEALMDCSKYLQRIKYICLFSAEEVHAAAERLGLSYDCSHCSLADAVLRELRIRDNVQFVTECAKAKDVRLLKDALIDADFGEIAKEAFSRLIAQLGLAMDEGTSKDTLKMGELLYRYYTESKEPVAEAPCSPNIQEASVIVDDIPADHEPDIAPVQEVGVSYEYVRQAYTTYENAMWDYKDSRNTDVAKKHEAEAAYREYLRLLVEYRKGAMPKRDMALRWIRKHCGEAALPVDRLKIYPIDKILEMSHACGIHAARFQSISKRDMAVRLLREAGIEPGLKTDYEYAVDLRKETQRELHEVWQQRHVLRKALHLLGEDSEEAQILRDMCCRNAGCPVSSKRIENMLNIYREECRKCAEGRRYEAENRGIAPAPVQEEKPAVTAEESEPEVQVVLADKPKTPRVYVKKSRKSIRKSHKPNWVQFPLTTKPSRQRVSKKPLVKLSKVASPARIRKF